MKLRIVTAFPPSERVCFERLAESALSSEFGSSIILDGRQIVEDLPARVRRALPPLTLLEALEAHKGQPVVWVDPSTRVIEEPFLLRELGNRIVYVPSRVSPTYVGNTRINRAWLKAWVDRAQKGFLSTIEARTIATKAAQECNAPMAFHFIGQDGAFDLSAVRREG